MKSPTTSQAPLVRSALGLLATLGLVGSFVACSDDGATDGSGGAGSTEGTSSENGSSGTETGSGFGTGGSTSTGVEPCAQQEAEATLVSKPVDIIFVIDNSGSMSGEIFEVEEQINKTFAAIIDAAVPAVDYRVIMLAAHGDSGDQAVCISAPLSGIPDDDADGHCDTIPAEPVNTAKFFHHSIAVSSHDALCRIIEDFEAADEFDLQPTGYQEVLRPEAFKFFVVITDDNVGTSCGAYDFDDNNTAVAGEQVAADFDAALFALSPEDFGSDAATRNYRFWSIIAAAPYNASGMLPYGEPAPPDVALAPITTAECTPDAQNPGTGYQALSILTGGYRYPSCGLEYTDMFELMALGVIEGAQVACEFLIPEPPEGETLNLDTVQVEYTSGANVQTFDQVATSGDCGADGFYIEGDLIILCPTTCDEVQADEDAEIDIKFGCELTPE